MKVLFTLFSLLITITVNAQYMGEVWLSNGDTLKGQIFWYPNQSKIDLVQEKEKLTIETPQLVGFILTDQYFYDKPVYKFYPKNKNSKVYRVYDSGKLELLWREKEWYVSKNEKIYQIEKRGDLWKLIKNSRKDIKNKMQMEFWHWKLDIDKIIKYYNQIN